MPRRAPTARARSTAALCLLAACTPCEETTYRGGTSAEQALAQGIVARFRGYALPFEVCAIELEPDLQVGSRTVAGVYNATTRKIRVDPDPIAGTFEQVLQHELCHALDLQNDVSRDADRVWPLDPNGRLHHDTPERRLDEEGFATWCELGPEALALVDREEAAELVAAAFPGLAGRVAPIARRSVATWTAPEGLSVRGREPYTRDDGAVELQLVDGEGEYVEFVALDVRTCAPVRTTLSWSQEPPATPLPAPWVTGGNAVGLPGHDALTTGWLHLPDGTASHPWFGLVGGRWIRLDDGAPSAPLRGVVARQGVAFGVESDGRSVTCWRWEP